MTKPKTPAAQAVYIASNKPGGYLPSEQLDRANAFASMRLAFEAALTGDRNEVTRAIREAIATYAPEFASHGATLTQAVAYAELSGRFRDLEAAVSEKVRFFAHAESATLGTAPKNLDDLQIHAAELERTNKAKAEQHRVRFTNY